MTVKMVSSSLRIFGLSLAVALVGCSGDDTSTSGASDSATDSDTSSTTDSTTTSTTQTSASGTTTTDSGTGTSDSSTGTTAPETTGETSGSGSTTGDPTTGTTGDPTTTTGDPTTTGTTGGADGNGCDEVCETITGCFPVTLDECMANCEGDFAMADGAECQAATAEVNMCLAGLDCQSFIDEDFAACGDAFVAQEMACGGGMQECVAEKAQMGPNCTVSFDCGMDQFAMQCNTNQGVCTCIENGQDGDTCDNKDFCALDLDAAIQAANDCCGWEF